MPQSEAIKKAVNSLRPEAREAIQTAKLDGSTKDGYRTIYTLCTAMPKPFGRLFLLACIEEGYPVETAMSIDRMIS